MTYSEFCKLLERGETDRIEYKIQCNAFESGNANSESAKAELAKDICALANNGNVASYLVIGVADDGKGYKSLSNAYLTSDNLHSFCKTAIFPALNMRVHDCTWQNAPLPHRGKRFVVVQIGPNATHAYRLNRDFIDLNNPDAKRRYCLRRNEVWIRRGATTDLGTPEEVARLLRGKSAVAPLQLEGDTHYSKFPVASQLSHLEADLRRCVAELGGKIFSMGDSGLRVSFPIRGKSFVWRCITSRDLKKAGGLSILLSETWLYEHGVLVLLLDGVSERAFPSNPTVHFRESGWGFFTVVNVSGRYSFGRLKELVPLNFPSVPLCVLTLSNLNSTGALRRSLTRLVEFANTDDESFLHLLQSRIQTISGLKRCLRQGWLRGEARFSWRRGKLRAGEFKTPRYPGVIVKRDKRSFLRSAATKLLALSAAEKSKRQKRG